MISERFESNIGQNRLRISKMPLNSIICKCYLENRNMLINNKNHATWLKGIDKLLNCCSLEYVFTNEIHTTQHQQ